MIGPGSHTDSWGVLKGSGGRPATNTPPPPPNAGPAHTARAIFKVLTTDTCMTSRLTAVYVGATLGMLTTPPLASLLPGLTIGMQRRQKGPHTKDRWSGWPTGEVLFSAGHRARHLNDYFISPASDPPLGLGFDLIADPTYHDGRGEEEVAALSAIQITPPQAR